MARPIKKGIDYFPLDVRLNDKMKLIETRFGLKGFAVVVKLWMKIYSVGYYCEWNEDVALLFASENRVGDSAVSEIVDEALRRGIFDRELFDKYGILTSEGIQERYFEAVSRRQKVEIDKRYLLINVPIEEVNVNKNPVNVDNNSKNVDGNAQTKGNKIKVNETRVNESRVEEGKASEASAFTSAADTAADTDIQPKSDIDKVMDHYRDRIGYGFVKEQMDCVQSWLDSNVEAEMINAAIEEAVSAGVKKFSYVKAIVEDRISRGITTLNLFNMQKKAYERRKSERDPYPAWGAKKNGFFNYTDTNKTDYDEIERIISSPEYLDMLIEEQRKT